MKYRTAAWVGVALGICARMTSHAALGDVSPYCEVGVELHAALDDPRFDLDLRDIGTDKAQNDFATVWLQFDERLRANTPDAKLSSALEVIAAHARSVVDRSTTRPSDSTYAQSLGLVLDYHAAECLPGD